MAPTRAHSPAARQRQTILREGTFYTDENTRLDAPPSWLELTIRRIAYTLVVGALASGLYFLLTDSMFQVNSINVTGAHFLDPVVVARAAGASGQNVFRLRSGAVTARVRGLGVPVGVTVEPRLPGTVDVAVVEPTVAYVWQVGGSGNAVSSEGIVLGPAPPGHFPTIVDADGQPVRVGDTVDAIVLREAAYVLLTLPIAAGFQIPSVTFSRQLGVSFRAPDGTSVIVGTSAGLTDKLASIGPLRKAAAAGKPPPSTIDLSVPGHPFFR